MNTIQSGTLHIFCGTAAEYLKLAPVLRELDRRGLAYRLIDSGQHFESARTVRDQLGLREPDIQLGVGREVDTLIDAGRWLISLMPVLLSRRQRTELFDGRQGICLVHGDTVTTLMATLIARRAQLQVGHVEAGLRSHSLFHPFPEELIRVLVMHRADLLFAPNATAAQNLAVMNVRGRVVTLAANTMLESLQLALGGTISSRTDGPVVMTLHRVENLHHKRRRDGFVHLALQLQRTWGVLLVLHPATRAKLGSTGQLRLLEAAGVTMVDMLTHREFIAAVAAARFVVTDGGSIQEECAALGVPCLLWRRRTERPDGLDGPVVVSRHVGAVVAQFLAQFEQLRRPQQNLAIPVSQQIVDVLDETLHGRGPH
ncbi:MAG: UDP-N-acetylglucosamine 2-epimerase [Nitriliruptoraceae bacterium]